MESPPFHRNGLQGDEEARVRASVSQGMPWWMASRFGKLKALSPSKGSERHGNTPSQVGTHIILNDEALRAWVMELPPPSAQWSRMRDQSRTTETQQVRVQSPTPRWRDHGVTEGTR